MITFDELDLICQQHELEYNAAECHGILSGMVCGNSNIKLHHWLACLVDDEAPPITNETPWNLVLESTLLQLDSDDLDFQLLLPDDDWPLSQRTEALANWCRGFLYGISTCPLKDQLTTSANIKEVIEDFSQISAASYDDREAEEEGEAAYMELEEYTRAATMLVYTELNTSPQIKTQTLH